MSLRPQGARKSKKFARDMYACRNLQVRAAFGEVSLHDSKNFGGYIERFLIRELHLTHSCGIFGLCDAKIMKPRPGRRGFLFAESIVRLIAGPRNRIRRLFLGVAHSADPEGEEARAEG